MYFQRQFALLVTAVAVINAQSIPGVPTCATTDTLQAFTATGCTTSDIACVCKANSFTSALQASAQKNCSPADYNSAITAARNLCSSAGVNVFPTSSSSMPASSASNSSAPSSSGTAPTSNTTSTATTTTTTNDRATSPVTGAVSISVTTRCTCETETITLTPTPTPTPATTTPVASFSGAAARMIQGSSEGALAGVMAAVGIAALL